MNKLNGYVPLNPGSVGRPDVYLGTNLNHMQLDNGIWALSMSPASIHEECVAKYLSNGYKFPRAENKSSYCPELDVSLILGPEDTSYY